MAGFKSFPSGWWSAFVPPGYLVVISGHAVKNYTAKRFERKSVVLFSFLWPSSIHDICRKTQLLFKTKCNMLGGGGGYGLWTVEGIFLGIFKAKVGPACTAAACNVQLFLFLFLFHKG